MLWTQTARVGQPAAALLRPASVMGPHLGSASFAAWQISIALLLLAGAMTSGITYDEDQYIAAGVMARHSRLYADFIHLQPPLYPLLLSALFGITDGHYLLVGRLLTWLLSMASFGLLFGLTRRLGAGRPLAALLVTACAASPFLFGPLSNTRNDILPLCLLLAGVALYLRADNHERRCRGFLALAGLCIGLAATAKVSYVFGPVAVVLHTLSGRSGPAAGPARSARLTPLLAGIGMAALPGLYHLALAPEGFLYGLVEYHLSAPIAWYEGEGARDLLHATGRVAFLAELLLLGGNGTLTVLALVFAMIRRMQRRAATLPADLAPPPGTGGLSSANGVPGASGLILGLLGGAALCGFLPRPSWPMYYAPVAPLLACWVALLHGQIRAAGPHRLLRLALWVSLVPTASVLGLPLVAVTKLPAVAEWSGVAVHRNALAIRDAIRAAGGADGDVATLFPIHVMDANRVRAEFASGPFFFRTAHLLPPDRIARLRGTGPEELERFFAVEPPAAIFGGLYADRWRAPMDAALLEYAERHNYTLAKRDIAAGGATGGRLYLRPVTAPPGEKSR